MENIITEELERDGVKMTDREALLLIRLTQNIPLGQYLDMGFTKEEREIMLRWFNDYTR